jgi:Tol biopolymer transport system component
MNKSPRRIPAFVVIGIGIVIGIMLVLGILAPRVTSFSPPSGSMGVSSMTRLTIRFSRPMSALSVVSRLQIEPALFGKLYWDGQVLIFEPDKPWPAGSTVKVTLLGGSQAENRLPMLGRRIWSFEIGQPSLVYLWPGEGKSELYQTSVEPGAQPVQLTDSEKGIQDYHMSVDGSLLIYNAYAAGGGTEIRAYDMISKNDRLLLYCPTETPCGAPALSPSAEWVAFERAKFVMGESGRLLPSITRVWLLPYDSEGEAVVVSPAGHTARNPTWSPKGWLVYFDDHLKALALMNPAQGLDSTPFNYIPTNLGILGSWSPDGTSLMYPDIIFPDEEALGQTSADGEPLYYSHLYLVDVTNGRTLDVSPGEDWMVEDASPSFSPDGRWVAFTRKFLDPQRWSPGRQVWLMNSERTDVKPLTDEPGATFSSLAWSPDSENLAFMRKSVADLSQPSEIWWVDVITGEAMMVVQGAFLPGWIP